VLNGSFGREPSAWEEPGWILYKDWKMEMGLRGKAVRRHARADWRYSVPLGWVPRNISHVNSVPVVHAVHASMIHCCGSAL
jgi:hypothetical protein